MFPRRIGQSGYNKRMRKAFYLFIRVIRMLAMDTSLWSDDVWVDRFHSGGVRPFEGDCPAQRRRRVGAVRLLRQSQRGTSGGCGCTWCAPCTGLPVLFALAGAKADEREILLGMLEAGRDVADGHPGQVLIGDKNYFGRHFEERSRRA